MSSDYGRPCCRATWSLWGLSTLAKCVSDDHGFLIWCLLCHWVLLVKCWRRHGNRIQRKQASTWPKSSFWSFCRLGERELRSGFLQTVYYFGTSFNFCIGLALFCGSLGFIGASKFVFLIYSNIKAEWSWVSEGNALRTPKPWCMQTWNREWHCTQLQLGNLLAIEEKRSARLSKEVVMRDRLDCLQVWC